MAELETLHLELESLLYAKNEEELKQFAALFEIDKDISTKSKFFILKTIQKSLDERVNVEGEEIQKVTWFKETIAKIKSSAGNQDSPPSELDALKEGNRGIKNETTNRNEYFAVKTSRCSHNHGNHNTHT